MSTIIEINSRIARDAIDFGRGFFEKFDFFAQTGTAIENWSAILLNSAYADEEPEYTDEDIKNWNPEYVEKR